MIDKVGIEIVRLVCIGLALVGVAGVFMCGGRLCDDWRERRRVKKIMEGR